MPFPCGHLDVGARDLLAFALHDAIEPDIVFKRVGAGDVVIVRRHQPHGDAAGPVHRPGDRLEPDNDIDVFRRDRLVDGEREAVAGFVGAGLGNDLLAGGGRVGHDPPFGGPAFAGAPEREVIGLEPGPPRRDVDIDGSRLGVDEALMIQTNEMARTLAILATRS